MSVLDLRADTCAQQSPAMRAVLAELQSGDDVFDEDPHTHALQDEAAERCGMQAALLFPSGTMANLAALLAHLARGEEVVVGRDSHIFNYELGGASALGGIAYHTVDDSQGLPDAQALRAAIRPGDLYHARTGLVCLENTHNLAGGVAATAAQLQPLIQVARESGLPVHLDGARLFHACAALDQDVRQYAGQVDSLMVSLSKGLGAPLGALLLGTQGFIQRARSLRKMLGGGMRQTGYLAAMGRIALQEGPQQLADDVRHARQLATALQSVPGLQVRFSEAMTNMVYFRHVAVRSGAQQYLPQFEAQGLRLLSTDDQFRFVLHNRIQGRDIPRIVDGVATVFQGLPVD